MPLKLSWRGARKSQSFFFFFFFLKKNLFFSFFFFHLAPPQNQKQKSQGQPWHVPDGHVLKNSEGYSMQKSTGQTLSTFHSAKLFSFYRFWPWSDHVMTPTPKHKTNGTTHCVYMQKIFKIRWETGEKMRKMCQNVTWYKTLNNHFWVMFWVFPEFSVFRFYMLLYILSGHASKIIMARGA